MRRSPRRMRAIVVEDEWAARRFLVELLHASGGVEVVASAASAREARELMESGIDIDVAFIDIHLASEGEGAGLDLARSLASLDRAPLTVLATALPQHALTAFELGVADYLLKPFSKERVHACVTRIADRTKGGVGLPRPVPRVVARSRKGLVLLDQAEVLGFEAAERLTFVHSVRGRFDVDLSLSALEESLGPEFLRVHRQWLVQLQHVLAIETDDGESFVVVGEGHVADRALRVPVSRERRNAVRELLLSGATGLRKG